MEELGQLQMPPARAAGAEGGSQAALATPQGAEEPRRAHGLGCHPVESGE
ncbi:unnamed protein product [Ectocarpus sp. CCAP 1310/34]|nr:unnamed protein product [Ectocarpus sp. CCAP 1310/34]